MATMPTPMPDEPVVVGRAREKEQLADLIEATASGKRGAVIMGPAGAGKSTLLRWARQVASFNGRVVASVRVPAGAGLPPLFPLGHIARELDLSLRSLALAPPASLNRLNKEVSGRSTRDSDAIFPTLAEALEECSALKPLALFVDDIHWCPREAGEILLSTLRAIDGNVLLACSARPEGRPGLLGLPVPTADLWLDYIPVETLNEAGVSELATLFLGKPLLPSHSNQLSLATGGNPLFVLETLRLWRQEDQLRLIGGYWARTAEAGDTSPSLTSLIRHRISTLSTESSRLLLFLGILSRETTFKEVAAILGSPLADAVDAARDLETNNLVEVSGQSVRVAHPLYATAIEDTHSPVDVAVAHGQIFAALDAIGAPVSELAHHAVASTGPPDDVVDLVFGAAAEAEEAGARGDAARWYEFILSNGQPSRELVLRALLGLGRVTTYALTQRAIEAFTSALPLASGQERIQSLLGRAEAFRVAGHFEQAMADLRSCAGMARAPLPDLRHRIAVLKGVMGDARGALVDLQELLSSGGMENTFPVRNHVAQAKFVLGDLRGAFDDWTQVMLNAEAVDTREHAKSNACWAAVLLGDWANADTLLTSGIAEAERARNLWGLQSLHSSAVKFSAWRGRRDLVAQHAAEAAKLASRLENPVATVEAAEAMGIASLAIGDCNGAISYLDEALRLARGTPEVRELVITYSALAHALRLAGAIERAYEVAEEAAIAIGTTQFYTNMIQRMWAHLFFVANEHDRVIECSFAATAEWLPFERGHLLSLAVKSHAALGQWEAAATTYEEARMSLASFGQGHAESALRTWWESHRPKGRGRPRSRLPLGITSRELDVIRALSEGLTTDKAASRLFLAPDTVKKYAQAARGKLGARNRLELIHKAKQAGLL